MLYPLETNLNTQKKLWFDSEAGNLYYGPDETDLIFAEAIEQLSGYKIPGRFYISDIQKAILLGMKIQKEILGKEDF